LSARLALLAEIRWTLRTPDGKVGS
jgi:hypothetical protein